MLCYVMLWLWLWLASGLVIAGGSAASERTVADKIAGKRQTARSMGREYWRAERGSEKKWVGWLRVGRILLMPSSRSAAFSRQQLPIWRTAWEQDRGVSSLGACCGLKSALRRRCPDAPVRTGRPLRATG